MSLPDSPQPHSALQGACHVAVSPRVGGGGTVSQDTSSPCGGGVGVPREAGAHGPHTVLWGERREMKPKGPSCMQSGVLRPKTHSSPIPLPA